MITNREEVLENALKVFAKMNYERASQTEIARACGLSKAGLIYYYPLKLDLFVAVADRYVFGMRSAASKLSFAYGSFAEFLEKYLGAVERTMTGLVRLLSDGGSPAGCSFNFHYFHLLVQVRLHYPDAEKKIEALFSHGYEVWRTALRSARESGEIRSDVDVDSAAMMFRQMFMGLSFEQAFLSGLDTRLLGEKFRFIYSLIKS